MGMTGRGRLRLMASYARGGSAGVPGPSGLMVETTVRCNLRCPMCPRTGVDYPQADLPDDLLYPLLEDYAAMGGDHVYLYGLGEPLLDPRIFDILARCRALGLGTVISSNGTLLNADRRRRLLDAGCDHFIVAIDGTDQETYGHYRAGGVYETVVAQVRALAAEKKARRAKMTLVVQFIRMHRNLHQQEDFLRLWRAVPGVDLVRLKEEDIGLPGHNLTGADGKGRKNPCFLLWRGPLVVRYTGDVYPCYHIAEQGDALGNLRDVSLADLWDHPEMQRLRSMHAAGEGEVEPCLSCPCIRPRRPFILGAMAVPGITTRYLIPLMERVSHRWPWIFNEEVRDPVPGEAGGDP